MRDHVKDITARIEVLQGEELDEILKAVVLRYGQLLPEYETVCLLLPKQDPAARQRILAQTEVICFPKREKDDAP